MVRALHIWFDECISHEGHRRAATALADPDVSLREETVDALGEIGGATAVLLLQQALADEQNSVRAAAAEWLAERSQHE